MSRASVDKPFGTFVGGFVTEATGLSFPENTAQDLSNVEIELSGKIRRRLGLTAQASAQWILDTFNDDSRTGQQAVTFHYWHAVGGNAELNFLVIQIGSTIYFTNADDYPVTGNSGGGGSFIGPIRTPILVPPYSSVTGEVGKYDMLQVNRGVQFVPPKLGFTFVGQPYPVMPADKTAWRNSPLQSVNGLGRLWLTGPLWQPFFLEYNPADQSILVKPVNSPRTDLGSVTAGYEVGIVAIRDQNFPLDRKYDNPDDNAVLTQVRLWRLKNAGWPDSIIQSYFASTGAWPAAEKVWYLGKDASGNFSDVTLNKNFFKSDALQGSQVVDALRTSRTLFTTTLTGTGLTFPFSLPQTEYADEAFSSCCFFSGRLWLAGDVNKTRPNGIYFSQVLQNSDNSGSMLSYNDPTDERFSDALATDGGVLYIQDADRIVKLVAAGAGVLAFAENGVWYIRGGLDGFKANNYTVDKISTIGCVSPESVVQSENIVFFWSILGIYVISFGNQTLGPTLENISDPKIKKFFSSIGDTSKRSVRGVFDFLTKRILWSYRSETFIASANGANLQSLRDSVLIYDLRLGAFSKHAFDFTGGIYHVGFINKRSAEQARVHQSVLVGTIPVVVTPATLVEVKGVIDGYTTFNTLTAVLWSSYSTGLNTHNAVISGEFTNADFLDWEGTNYPNTATPIVIGQMYSSFIETAPLHLGDFQRYKEAVFVHTFFDRSETTFEDDGIGTITPTTPSSCFMQAKFDWQTSGVGSHWSLPQQAYRHRKNFTPVDATSIWDTGEGVEYSKLKPRGKGRAIALRYYSETNKDFQLLGFSIPVTANAS